MQRFSMYNIYYYAKWYTTIVAGYIICLLCVGASLASLLGFTLGIWALKFPLFILTIISDITDKIITWFFRKGQIMAEAAHTELKWKGYKWKDVKKSEPIE